MYNARYLEPRPRTGSDTVLHLKPFAGLVTTSTLFDYSLNAHPGTLKATAALKFPGCDLDGDSDYIEVADHADFSPILTPFSISAWVYMHDATSFVIAEKGGYNTHGEWLFWLNADDKIQFRQFDESVDNCYIGRKYGTALTSYENYWIHLLVTSDGGLLSSGIIIYFNGGKIDDANQQLNQGSFEGVENLGHAVWIGRSITAGKYANGLIDETIIYKKELSATEVRSIYEVTRSRYGV